MNHPWAVFLSVSAGLVVLGLPFIHLRVGSGDVNALPPSAVSEPPVSEPASPLEPAASSLGVGSSSRQPVARAAMQRAEVPSRRMVRRMTIESFSGGGRGSRQLPVPTGREPKTLSSWKCHVL